MALSVETQVPTVVQEVKVTLIDRLAYGEEPAEQRAVYELEVFDQNNRRIAWPGQSGDLVPYLTPEQVQTLLTFMGEMRALRYYSLR